MLKLGLLQISIKGYLSNKNSFDNWVRPIFYGKSSKNENWAEGAFQKQICFCSTTADSRQLIFKLTNGNSHDIIINSDSSWPFPWSDHAPSAWLSTALRLLCPHLFLLCLKYLMLVCSTSALRVVLLKINTWRRKKRLNQQETGRFHGHQLPLYFRGEIINIKTFYKEEK